MGKIVYRPVCGKCNNIIKDDIYILRFESPIGGIYRYKIGECVYPAFCPYCGDRLDEIWKDTSAPSIIQLDEA